VQADYPFVQAIPRKNGTLRYFFRRKGHRRARLPGKPGSPEFIAAYDAALTAEKRVEPSETMSPGTVKALCREYEGSAEFLSLAESTRREMGYVLKRMAEKDGDFPVRALKRRHILTWRDQLKEKPGAANKMIRTLKVLLQFAMDRDYRDDNPAMRVKLLKLGEWRPWTAEECARFEARWPIGTMERAGYALARHTGQRRADLAALTFDKLKGGALAIQQGKTEAEVYVPLHADVKAALAALTHREGAVLRTANTDAPMNPVYFGHLMAAAIGAAELPDDCVLHGLRKTMAVAMVENGVTSHQVASVTGHKTVRMIEHYVARKNRQKLATDAMKKMAAKPVRTKREGVTPQRGKV
jgi:integrase